MQVARDLDIEVLVRTSFYENDLVDGPKKAVDLVKESDARVVLFFGFSTEIVSVILYAKQVGVYSRGFVWICSEGVAIDYNRLSSESKKLIQGTLIFLPKEGQGPEYDRMITSYQDSILNTTSPYRLNNTLSIPMPFSMNYASCLDLLVRGIDRVYIAQANASLDALTNGTYQAKLKVPSSFQFDNTVITPTGHVSLDWNGERIGEYSIYNAGETDIVDVATWSNGNVILSGELITYPGGSTAKPLGRIDPSELAGYVSSTDGFGVLSLALGIIGIVLVTVVILLFIKYRKHKLLVSSSFHVSIFLLSVLYLNFLQLIIMPGIPTSSFCKADTTLLVLSFSLFYGNLIAKSVRLYKIFYVIKTNGGNKWTDRKVILFGSLFAMINIILIIIWNTIDNPSPMILKRPGTKDYFWTCRSQSASFQSTMLTTILLYCGIILLGNLMMAVKTRGIPSKFQETKTIGLSVYNLAIVLIFAIPTLVSQSLDYQSAFAIKVIVIAYCSFFNLFTMFLHKLFLIYSNTYSSGTSTKGAQSENVESKMAQEEIGRMYKSFSKVSLKITSGFSMFNEYRLFALILNQDSKSIYLMPFMRATVEDQLQSSGHCTAWVLPTLKVFTCAKNEASLSVNVVVESTKYHIKFNEKDQYQNWVNIFELWQTKVSTADSFSTKLLNK
ncbi:GPCR, family 3 domain-containing protein [Rozella allomycis CSF55]|uniref:GPCR, family 3 domain-containing protein n=1 Tax=Rozella allomycis (strain CSF55) TaxID=988480 RepID=A0A075AQE2_ROZAC|nr:GPCR, family 3 domain-containing protein [Rozella allomycis CSF55]|eukprot:EPZ30817.1 GPCR, family 3 domain-containing protein [Rozella allomycis CSF55]